MTDTCRAILYSPARTPRMYVGSVAIPEPGPGQILVRVNAAGVNRAEVDQSRGLFSPPPGASPVLGLEVSGEVAMVGSNVTRFRKGMRVMSLVSGGSYAEYCLAEEATSFEVPAVLSDVEAAAIPEAYFTFWANAVELGHLSAGETFLVHGGASGVGSASIQLAKLRCARVIATVSGAAKAAACRKLGANLVIDRTQEGPDFSETIERMLGSSPVDVVLDWVGSGFLERHLRLLRRNGRLVLIDSTTGDLAQVDLGTIMTKQLVVTGSILRPRPQTEKAALAQELRLHVLPHVERGEIRPLISQVFPFELVNEAHECIESNRHIGKVVLSMGPHAA